jgi:hypothetical protein
MGGDPLGKRRDPTLTLEGDSLGATALEYSLQSDEAKAQEGLQVQVGTRRYLEASPYKTSCMNEDWCRLFRTWNLFP